MSGRSGPSGGREEVRGAGHHGPFGQKYFSRADGDLGVTAVTLVTTPGLETMDRCGACGTRVVRAFAACAAATYFRAV